MWPPQRFSWGSNGCGSGGLVLFEAYDDIATAIACEKALKKWWRPWKLALIEKENPHWCDLYPEIAG